MDKKKIRVCCGMTCGVVGAGRIMKKIEESTGLKHGESNETIDLNYCSCTGNCHLAPNVAVNGNFVNQANPDTVMDEIEIAANLKPEDIEITDASFEEIANNDFLGDI